MTCNEFADLICKIAEERGFECEYLLIMGDKEGKLHSYLHEYNERIKPCKLVRFLSRLLRIPTRKFERA